MKSYLKIYGKFISKYFKSKMEYKVSFFLDIFVNMITPLSFFSIIYIILGKLDHLQSWNTFEVMLMFSFSLLSWGLAGFLFWSPFVQMEQLVLSGEFDNYLIRPLHPLIFLIFKNFQYTFIGQTIIGGGVMVYSLINLNVVNNGLFISKLIFLIVNSTMLQISILICLTTSNFYFRKSLTFSMIIVSELQQMSRYPINIFNNVIRVIITFIVPYAFVSYYPVAILMNRNVSEFISIFTFILGLLLLYASIMFFNFSLSRYTSSGN